MKVKINIKSGIFYSGDHSLEIEIKNNQIISKKWHLDGNYYICQNNFDEYIDIQDVRMTMELLSVRQFHEKIEFTLESGELPLSINKVIHLLYQVNVPSNVELYEQYLLKESEFKYVEEELREFTYGGLYQCINKSSCPNVLKEDEAVYSCCDFLDLKNLYEISNDEFEELPMEMREKLLENSDDDTDSTEELPCKKNNLSIL